MAGTVSHMPATRKLCHSCAGQLVPVAADSAPATECTVQGPFLRSVSCSSPDQLYMCQWTLALVTTAAVRHRLGMPAAICSPRGLCCQSPQKNCSIRHESLWFCHESLWFLATDCQSVA